MVRATYIGLREKRKGPSTTRVVAGSDGLTFVPAASMLRRLHNATAAPMQSSGRPITRATFGAAIGCGKTVCNNTPARKATP
jgi:hypothetical protein